MHTWLGGQRKEGGFSSFSGGIPTSDEVVPGLAVDEVFFAVVLRVVFRVVFLEVPKNPHFSLVTAINHKQKKFQMFTCEVQAEFEGMLDWENYCLCSNSNKTLYFLLKRVIKEKCISISRGSVYNMSELKRN